MLVRLPQAKTYLPGPGRCIYCPPENTATDDLRREHIIAKKLGGQLVLHNAACRSCEAKINKEIETPALTFMWLAARTHLGLPTSRPPDSLNIGTWDSSESGLPKNMDDVNFQWKSVPVSDHPFRMMQVRLAPPGILTDRAPTKEYQAIGMEAYSDSRPDPPTEGKQVAQFQPYSPDLTCRMIAKIAHGAAVAALGAEAFKPLLPDLIMGRTEFGSHLVGGSNRKGRKRGNLHEVSLTLSGGYIVADVQMFASLGLRAHQAVVGAPTSELAKWHLSTLISNT